MENEWNLTHNTRIVNSGAFIKRKNIRNHQFALYCPNSREFTQFKKKNNNHNYYLNTHENPQEIIGTHWNR